MNFNYYQQPYMNSQYQPYDRLNQLQQFQQNLQQPQNFINGKVVDSLEMVKAMDIPIDGMNYYFPKADGTEIYMKRWLPTGQTQVISYKPILDQNNTEPNNLPLEVEKEQIKEIKGIVDTFIGSVNERFDRLEKLLVTPKKTSTKKESETE